MLAVQVSYLNLLENQKHNRVTEQLQKEANAISKNTLDETVLHNRNQEHINMLQAEAQKQNAQASLKQAENGYISALAAQRSADASMVSAQANLMNARTNAQRANFQNQLAIAQVNEAKANVALREAQKTVAEKDAYLKLTQAAYNEAQKNYVQTQTENYGFNLLFSGASAGGTLFKGLKSK